MSEPQNDPFTVCNKAIFDALITPGILALFASPRDGRTRTGNLLSTVPRAGFVDAERKIQAKDPASSPELLVTQGGILFQPKGRNSRLTGASAVYLIQASTDQLNVVPINRLKWEICKALDHAVNEPEHPFGLKFVIDVTARDGQEGTANADANRGSPGWALIFALSVEMYWPRGQLLP